MALDSKAFQIVIIKNRLKSVFRPDELKSTAGFSALRTQRAPAVVEMDALRTPSDSGVESLGRNGKRTALVLCV